MNEILNSPSGKRCKEYISPIYEESIYGKWLLQAIGVVLDELNTWINEYCLQIVPQSATWGLEYYEKEYKIPVDLNASINSRRNAVILKMQTRLPMNPVRFEKITSQAAGVSCRVVENTAKNTFEIWLSAIGQESINIELLKQVIAKAKPTHLLCEIKYEQGAESKMNFAAMVGISGSITIRQVN